MAMQEEAMAQLARLLGRWGLAEELAGLGQGEAARERLRRLVRGELSRLTEGLLREAAACDDVTDRASALAYLEERLTFFGDLLDEEQRAELRARFREAVHRWH